MPRSTITSGGASQNTGNKIGEVPSVRVAAPPGGATSFSLAWGLEPAAAPTGGRGGVRAPFDPYATSAPAPVAAPPAPGCSQPIEPSPAHAFTNISNVAHPSAAPALAPVATGGVHCSSNAYASGANQNSGALSRRRGGALRPRRGSVVRAGTPAQRRPARCCRRGRTRPPWIGEGEVSAARPVVHQSGGCARPRQQRQAVGGSAPFGWHIAPALFHPVRLSCQRESARRRGRASGGLPLFIGHPF